jgi:hypothetical protein
MRLMILSKSTNENFLVQVPELFRFPAPDLHASLFDRSTGAAAVVRIQSL